jgi:hypothetical protein
VVNTTSVSSYDTGNTFMLSNLITAQSEQNFQREIVAIVDNLVKLGAWN